MVQELENEGALLSELERIQPAELLMSEDQRAITIEPKTLSIKYRPPWEFELSTATSLLNQQFNTRKG